LLDRPDPLLALFQPVALRGGEAPLRLGLRDGASRGGELLREPVGTRLPLELAEATLALGDRRRPLAQGRLHQLDLPLHLGVGRVAPRSQLAREAADLLEVEPGSPLPPLVVHGEKCRTAEAAGKAAEFLQPDSLR